MSDFATMEKKEQGMVQEAPSGDEPPPLYQVNPSLEEVAPPSYEEARKYPIVVVATVLLLCWLLPIPIALIAIGSLYLHDCPAASILPIYLVVGGVVLVYVILFFVIILLRDRQEDETEEDDKENDGKAKNGKSNQGCTLWGLIKGVCGGILVICGFLGLIFLCVWIFLVSIRVYMSYGEWSDDAADIYNYCNPVLYWFAFSVVTSLYISLGLICLCGCAGCLLGIKAVNESEQEIPTQATA